MKKYLLPLILILLLSFTLIGNCANLYGTYDQRIKLTIDNTKIDATLTWIPITVLLTSTAGEEVFVEFDADADFDRVAFTTSDESTQLYADCELFDDSAQKAIYHVSKTGWSIASGADTDFYMYYDNDAGHNATYISKAGVSGSQYPTAHTDTYVKSTTKVNTFYWAYYATDPSESLTGIRSEHEWLSAEATVTNQRFHIDLGSAKIINKIYYENSHDSGGDTDVGVQNFTFQGSNTGAGTFDDLVYANDEGWITLATSQSTFDQHTGSDAADPKYITVTNATAYRYYAFKFADNYGDGTYMGVRHIVLQRTVAAENVYDGNFKAVYHMMDATTSTILDSTSNNHNGTKTGANNPNEVAGLNSALAQEHTGNDESSSDITIADHADFDSQGDFSIMAVVYCDTFGDVGDTNYECNVLTKRDATYNSWLFNIRGEEDATNAGKQQWAPQGGTARYSTNAISLTTWTQIGINFDNTAGSYVFYKDGVANGNASVDITPPNNGGDVSIGGSAPPSAYTHDWDGKIGEVRYSDTNRSAAWIKATYNSLWDSLLTYGSEETEEVGINVINFGCNF